MPNSSFNYKAIGPSTLSSWIRSICQTIRGYGVDPVPLMEQAGLDVQLLNIPDARYEIAGVRRLWGLVIAQTQDPLIGLKVGQEIQASTLHGLGLAMLSSSSLSELLSLVVRYCKAISTTMRMSLEHDKGGTTLVLRTADGCEPMHAARIAMIAFVYRQACQLVQHEVVPEFVTLALPYNSDMERLDRYFKIPVSMGTELDAIRFRYEDTIEPYAGANPQLVKINEHVIQQYMSQLEQSNFSNRVLQHIQMLLSKGEPKLSFIARELNLSPRTLQRRLDREGTSFNALLEKGKRHLASDMLAHSDTSVTEISYLLGFSDPSNFSRACNRWFGCSPVAYRQRNLSLQT